MSGPRLSGMSTRSPRSQLLLSILALTLAACGGTGSTPTPATTIPPTAATEPTAAPTTEPTDDATQPADPSQTDTEWGRIWDALPPDFPRYPGATIAEDVSPEPVSAAYALPDGDPAEIAEWMQTSLEMATFSTEGMSGPFEDGGFVLDSVGDGDCRIQTTVAPKGSLIIVTVRYGAACPI